MLRRTLYLTLVLSALVPVAACEDTRQPTAIAAEWFRPYGQETVARCIIQHESAGNPRAVSPTHDYGMFQINRVHRADFERYTGRDWSAIFDPNMNGLYARKLWREQGWRPWSTHRRCGV